MILLSSEWTDRINHWIRTLKNDFYKPVGTINWAVYRTMNQVPPEQVAELYPDGFELVNDGWTWGRSYEYCWFRGEAVIPNVASGKRIVLDLKPGGESTLFVNGKSFGTYRAEWVKEKHHYLVDNTLTKNAMPGSTFEILMETYAGHYYPECPTGNCATGPVLPGAFADTKIEGQRIKLGNSTYGIWNEDAYQLYMDVMTLWNLLTVLDQTSLRAEHIAEGLEKFTLTVDFEQNSSARNNSYQKACEELAPLMSAVNGSTAPIMYAIGNAHLDLAWLWPMAETYRKTERTFAQQLRLIDEYPKYKYLQSQPAAYEMCREHYPELFERIKAEIAKGQWIAEGAMWVEPDTNMSGGEALVRQILYGKVYFKKTFDADSKVLWLPDTFGYSAVLPQILKKSGIKYLVTQKIYWSYNEGEEFPYHYFNWRGMDGSVITAFLPTSYTYDTNPAEMNDTWQKRRQADIEGFLIPFGYGDGGGGPTRDHIEYALRQKNIEGGVKMKLAGPLEFFEDMDKLGGPRHTYTGELYFTAHRGTYTSQAKVKKSNRAGEALLRETEIWNAIASRMVDSYEYPSVEMEQLWKKLLLNQFHDILPGSSIARVYKDALAEYAKLMDGCTKMRTEALDVLTANTGDSNSSEKHPADEVSFYNSLGFERTVVVDLPEEFETGAKQALITIPALSAVTVIRDRENRGFGVASVSLIDGMFVLENGKIRAAVNSNGEITSYILKDGSQRREFAAEPMNHLKMYKDVPRKFDSWDIDSNYIEQEMPESRDISTEVICKEGLAAILKVTGIIGESKYEQYIRLDSGSTVVEIKMKVEWNELHRLLKVSFPVNVMAEEGVNEIQFGYIKRPTHRSRAYDQERFEVCNHRYSALCDGAHGAAVLNDCKYGISMNENRLELTLLTAAACPEMRADNGTQEFRYGFTAWDGTFEDSDVVRKGIEFNTSVTYHSGNSILAGTGMYYCNRENVILETVKLAEDESGDIILRLYESKKEDCMAYVKMPIIEGADCFDCDLLENIQSRLIADKNVLLIHFGAFEIKTIRICKKEKNGFIQ